ncbi:DUF4190 domain-containing protein [Streptomyces subrutilus]|uniref:DUF4190 domain-containing protein n=1 Tax=Streptomyces subrutilus TaxID=36818 RepID=A0A1E5PWJ2_9ACTN|nr:DUF4190 domain-containing protein [Streptomyces subrutilus]OEJ33968.1 hypothetical protein BGK67_23865 [Streptomyces subrutilus]
MTDQSPEPRDPWAPLERPAVDLGKQQAAPGAPSVHDQPTLAGMPGAAAPQPAPQSAAPQSAPAPAVPPAYGYPAQPDPGGYGYPTAPSAVPGYGYPGDTGYQAVPGYPGYPGYSGYQGTSGYPLYATPKSNGFGVTALVLGILSVVGCITSFLAIGIGIGAVVFGALGKGKATRGEADNGGMALAGIILGAIGIVLGGLMLLAMFVPFLEGDWDDGSRYDSPYSDSREREKI